jgi:hypothetical protein
LSVRFCQRRWPLLADCGENDPEEHGGWIRELAIKSGAWANIPPKAIAISRSASIHTFIECAISSNACGRMSIEL